MGNTPGHKWWQLLALAGLGTGEFFGFNIVGLAIFGPLFSHLPFVGVLNVSELTFVQVIKILKVSWQ